MLKYLLLLVENQDPVFIELSTIEAVYAVTSSNSIIRLKNGLEISCGFSRSAIYGLILQAVKAGEYLRLSNHNGVLQAVESNQHR